LLVSTIHWFTHWWIPTNIARLGLSVRQRQKPGRLFGLLKVGRAFVMKRGKFLAPVKSREHAE